MSCQSTAEWIKGMCCTYKVEYYAAIRKNEILSFVAMWMEVKDIMLSKISQAQKDKFFLLSLIC
jgi:hypothetical protein